MLFKDIYSFLPDFYLPLEKSLINECKCIVCGSSNKEFKDLALIKKQQGKCLICDSELTTKVSENNQNLIDEINDLYKEKTVISNQLSNINEEINIVKQKSDELNLALKALLDETKTKKQKIIYTESLISEKVSGTTDTFTEVVKQKQNEIEKLTLEAEALYKESAKAKEELYKLNETFKKIITDLNQTLSSYFNKYASTFIGLRCELTVEEKVINKIPHIVYLPKIDGQIRDNIWSVSESQRFFLDQAFRMAIIDYLQTHIPGFRTFFITETPEGSLDISYEEKVAEMFQLFAMSKNNIIFTSNLNGSHFLIQIYKNLSMEERKLKTLNLLEKGRLTSVQINNPELHNIQLRLFEEVIG